MRSRASLIMSAAALATSILWATPVGGAARGLVLPRNSVGTAQLKNNAVTSAKVSNGSLRSVDFAAGQLPTGRVFSQSQSVPNYNYLYLSVPCPAGQRAVGGGANSTSAGAVINESFPVDANGNAAGSGAIAAGWSTQVLNESGGTLTVTYYAVCVGP